VLSLTASKIGKLLYQHAEICTFGSMSSKVKKGQKDAKNPQEGRLKAWFQKNKLSVLLFILVFAVYVNGIFNEYALDDEFYTAGSNKLTQQGIKGIPEIFKSRTFFNTDGSGYSYRPVSVSSFALEIQFFGEKPHVSHFINVLLFGITVLLFFGLLKMWFPNKSRWFPFFIALLFLVHPIHTETVDNIKCRDEILALFFAILAMRSAWKHGQSGSIIQLVLAATYTLLGILSKTSILPIVVLSPFSVWYFSNQKWYKPALYLGVLAILAAIVKITLTSKLPEVSRDLLPFENPLTDMSRIDILPVAFYVMARYLWLMFIPHPLIFYYGLNEVPLATWSNPVSIAGLVLCAALAVYSFKEFRKRSAAGFGLIFFMLNALAFSNILAPAPGIMAERFLTIASMGFCIAAIDILFRVFKTSSETFEWKAAASSNLKLTFVSIAVLFSIRTIARNEAWENKETLYRNDVELAPESAKINMLLGSLLSAQAAQANYEAQQILMQAQQLMMQGNNPAAQQAQQMASEKKRFAIERFGEAREYYTQATEIFPSYYTAWSNLGTAYYFTQEYRKGVPYFKRAITIKKDYAEAYFNLGMSYEQLSKTNNVVTDSVMLDSCVWYFSEGLKQDPEYVNSADQLSRVYMTHYKDSSAAMNVLRNAAKANPKSDVPYNAMSTVYLQYNDTISAAAVLEKAAAVNPENILRLERLSMYFFRQGNNEKGAYYRDLAARKNKERNATEKRTGKKK
jgi:tetratricopeptide (TPR) repeat protein